MVRLLVRVCLAALVGAVAAWFARAVAHSKRPAPEGRWREMAPDDLAASP